jgi:hypothetical protein
VYCFLVVTMQVFVLFCSHANGNQGGGYGEGGPFDGVRAAGAAENPHDLGAKVAAQGVPSAALRVTRVHLQHPLLPLSPSAAGRAVGQTFL